MNDLPVLNVWRAEHQYGARKILRGVDLTVHAGEIYALLGPGGAGKSTLIGAICGRFRLSAGEVALEGQDPVASPGVRARLGLAPQELALYDHMTVRENLAVFGRLAGVRRRDLSEAVHRAMQLTGVSDREHARVRQLSGGHRRRVNIAAAILHRPRLLILDDPTLGVEAGARAALDTAIRNLRDSGAAVLLVTQDLDHAGGLADRVGFLREGRKILEGPPRALIEQAFGPDLEILVRMEVEPDVDGQSILASEGLKRGADNLWARVDPDAYKAAAGLDRRLRSLGLAPREIRVRAPSLHSLFSLAADWSQAA